MGVSPEDFVRPQYQGVPTGHRTKLLGVSLKQGAARLGGNSSALLWPRRFCFRHSCSLLQSLEPNLNGSAWPLEVCLLSAAVDRGLAMHPFEVAVRNAFSFDSDYALAWISETENLSYDQLGGPCKYPVLDARFTTAIRECIKTKAIGDKMHRLTEAAQNMVPPRRAKHRNTEEHEALNM